MEQENGKPVLPSTVVKHLFTALSQGHPVDLSKVALASPPPTRSQWEALTDAEAAIKRSVVEEKVQMNELLVPFLPEAAIPFAERSAEDFAKLAPWYPLVDWYFGLRRAGIEPQFDSKRPRHV